MGTPQNPTKILVVDDDPTILRLVRTILQKAAFKVFVAKDGREGLDGVISHSPHLIILDLLLPGPSGLDVCRELRTWYKGPILILSGYGEEEVIVSALDLGADDYITKPFRVVELLARVRALLRRVAKQPVPGAVRKIGELELNLARRRLTRKGVEISLTRTEFDIVACLIENLDWVVTSKMILETVWGPHHGEYNQTLRVHIGHIRKKIEPDPSRPCYVLTEPGVGYRFSIPAEQAAAG